MGVIMRHYFIVPLIAFLFFIISPSFAETVTFEKEYTYEASELDSKVTSRFNALEQAKRMLLEELGVFLISRTEIANSQLTKDEITLITAGIVSTVVLDEKWDGHKYWLKAKIDADPSVVKQAIDVFRQDDKKTKDLEQAGKRIEQLSKDLEAVKSDLASSPQERQKRYTEIVNHKQSEDLVIEFYNKVNMKKSFAENREALDAINKAIELDPEYLVPYVMRSALYGEVAKDYQRGVEDMTTAIKYFVAGPNNPYENTAMLYEARGVYYLRQNKLRMAAGDFMTALEVDPNGILMPKGMVKDADIELFVNKLPKDYRSYILRARYNSQFISGTDAGKSDKDYVLKKNKVYDSAIADINKALKLNNKNPIAYYLLTEAHGYKARWYDIGHINEVDTVNHNAIIDAATKGLSLVLTKEWKNRFLHIRAQEYLTLKQYKQAISDYNSLIELYPEYAGTYHDRAIAYKELGEFDNALSDLTKAIGMKHDTMDWPRTAYEIRAAVYEAMGKYKEAIEDYSNAYNTWDKTFGAYLREQKSGSGVAYDILYKRANARRKNKDYAKAIEDYRLALQWMDVYTVNEEIGDTLMEMEKPEGAIAEYDTAISKSNEMYEDDRRNKIDTVASSYYQKKAQAYEILEKVDKAIENYKLALDAVDNLPPLKEEIYRSMGFLYKTLGINQEFKGPADFYSYSMLGWMELETGNANNAFQTFNKMVGYYPKSRQSYIVRGNANLSFGNYKEAITDFNKALDISPTDSYAYYMRGSIYYKLGNYQQGNSDFKIAARLGHKPAQEYLKGQGIDW